MPVSTPIITSNGGAATASITLKEGATAVTMVQATDADSDALTYSIIGGLDRYKFKIDAVTGELRFLTPPDFSAPKDNGANNVYDVIVQVADGPITSSTTLKKTQTIAVTVTAIPPATLNGTAGHDVVGPVGTTIKGDTLNGLGGNDTLDGGVGADSMRGGTGNDVYWVDNAADQAVENAAEGTDTVNATVSYVLGANVEALVLQGSTAINGTGNISNNVLTGNSAANILDGGAGADTMTGGAGADTYVVDNAGDVTVELDGGGTDLVKASVTHMLGDFIENLTLTGADAISGTGNSLNNVITGNIANNTLTGGQGNDTMDGGVGADTLVGGLGNDVYVVDNSGDVATEALSEGTDTVRASITYTLGANVENLVLTGSGALNGTGNGLNNSSTGNAAANTLTGAGGDDILDGGAGIDTMIGGNGKDTYHVDNGSDVVTEQAAQGTDTVISTVNYILAANAENLTLSGSAISGTGNDLDNIIKGNNAANTLFGGVGNDRLDGLSGSDSMSGGVGDDTYIVNANGDSINELASEGTDIVLSSVTFQLSDNVENLSLTGQAALSGYGNALDNILKGNIGANTLNGGAGNDTIDGDRGSDNMIGGIGNDTFIVRDTGDVVTEAIGEGTDTSISYVISRTLSANVENLTLATGAALNGTGNDLANVVTGNANWNFLDGGIGNDTLIGAAGSDTMVGGLGQDTMTGGTEVDYFVFTSLLDSTKVSATSDLITDFSLTDVIDLSAIDARTDQTLDQAFVLDANSVLAAGEVMQSRSGNIITVSILTNPSVSGAEMLFRVQVDASVTGLLTADNFIL